MLHCLRFSLIIWVFLCPIVCAEEPPKKDQKFAVHGSVRTVLDFMQDEIDGTDVYLGSFLRFDVTPLFDERLAFHFYGRLWTDLNGESPTDKALKNSYNRIIQAYLDVRKWPDPFNLRLGRQWIYEVDGVYLDGARLEVPKWGNFEFLLFGGQPVSFYSSTQGQSIFGGQVGYHPFASTYLRVGGVRCDEDYPIVDSNISVHVDQRFGKQVWLSYYQNFLNERSKDLYLTSNANIQPFQLQLRGNYYRRINRTPVPDLDDVYGNYFSEYYLLLNSVEKLDSFGFVGTKYLGERLAVSGGVSLTRIRGMENPSNRNSERYYFSLQLFNLFLEKLTLSVDANWVNANVSSTTTTTFTDVDGSTEIITTDYNLDDDTFMITGQMDYTFGGGVSVAVGSTYGDFDFARALSSNQPVLSTVPRDLLKTGVGQRFITRTYFTSLNWVINKSWSAKLLVEYNVSRLNTDTGTGNYMGAASTVEYRF